MAIVGPYVVGEYINKGKFGRVYAGVHSQSQLRVALKLLSRDSIRSMTTVFNEVSAMASVNHENVLRVYELIGDVVFQNERFVALAVELAPNKELFDWLSTSIVDFLAFEEIVAKSYFAQIISGIAACHQRNVVHRDIKLENILLNEHLQVKIADFGLSAFASDASVLKTCCGSEPYMSPELLRKEPYIGSAVDVFAAGCVLFSMLVGVSPFQTAAIDDPWYACVATGRLDTFWKVHEEAYQRLKGCPLVLSAEAKDLVNRMLHPDGQARITVPGILAHPFLTTGQILSQVKLAAHMRERRQAILEKEAARRDQLPHEPRDDGGDRYRGHGDDDVVDPMLAVFSEDDAGLFHFECKFSVRDALASIVSFLSGYHPAASAVLDSASIHVEANVPCEGETMRVRVQLFRHAEIADLRVVNVQRLEGDRECFRDLFGHLREELTGIEFKREQQVGSHFQMLSREELTDLIQASEQRQ